MLTKDVWAWYGLALVITVLDQLTKLWASASLNYNEPLVFTSFFNFTLLHNYGAAFSFLSDAGGWQRWFFSVLAVVISIIVAGWIAHLKGRRSLEVFGLALVLGGAIGNVYDRLTLGYVVDFIVFHYEHHYWPAFNIADSAITVGAGALILDMFQQKESSPKGD